MSDYVLEVNLEDDITDYVTEQDKSYSTNFCVPAGKNGSITGYIPAIKTSGKMKDVLIDANTADFYEISTNYITVNTSYVPLKNDMHFVNKTW